MKMAINNLEDLRRFQNNVRKACITNVNAHRIMHSHQRLRNLVINMKVSSNTTPFILHPELVSLEVSRFSTFREQGLLFLTKAKTEADFCSRLLNHQSLKSLRLSKQLGKIALDLLVRRSPVSASLISLRIDYELRISRTISRFAKAIKTVSTLQELFIPCLLGSKSQRVSMENAIFSIL